MRAPAAVKRQRWWIEEGRFLLIVSEASETVSQPARMAHEVGIEPLIEKAMGVRTFREARADETEFMTISYWESREAMSNSTGDDPTQIHHI